MRAERATGTVLAGLIACALGSACGGDDSVEPMCIDRLPASCEPGFDPTWDNVYKFVVEQRCGGSTGTQCHGPNAKQGNLVLYDQARGKDRVLEALLGTDGTHARVEPNDPACSMLMDRLTRDDDKRMPFGQPKLDDRSICAVQQWIEQGAKP